MAEPLDEFGAHSCHSRWVGRDLRRPFRRASATGRIDVANLLHVRTASGAINLEFLSAVLVYRRPKRRVHCRIIYANSSSNPERRCCAGRWALGASCADYGCLVGAAQPILTFARPAGWA
uniref:Uncharacterized protein n=1 Tax=Trichuris muris TaxID=70415 RepID=A0A5S6QBJ2_TRIMR